MHQLLSCHGKGDTYEKDIPFWHSFKGKGLKKLGFVLSETCSDETGEVLVFKNSKNYIHSAYLSIDTMSGDFLFYTITTGITGINASIA